MKIHYLEIVARDVDAVCAAYASAKGVAFTAPVAELGNARTAALDDGGLLGGRFAIYLQGGNDHGLWQR